MLEIIVMLSGMEIVGAREAKRFKLDAHYLIGLRRVPYSCIRSVLEALPAELRKDCKVDTVEQDLKKCRKRHLGRRPADTHRVAIGRRHQLYLGPSQTTSHAAKIGSALACFEACTRSHRTRQLASQTVVPRSLQWRGHRGELAFACPQSFIYGV